MGLTICIRPLGVGYGHVIVQPLYLFCMLQDEANNPLHAQATNEPHATYVYKESLMRTQRDSSYCSCTSPKAERSNVNRSDWSRTDRPQTTVRMSTDPIFYVNGKRYALPVGRGELTLLQFLRGAARQQFAWLQFNQPNRHCSLHTNYQLESCDQTPVVQHMADPQAHSLATDWPVADTHRCVPQSRG
jgi:hypothetical protein